MEERGGEGSISQIKLREERRNLEGNEVETKEILGKARRKEFQG